MANTELSADDKEQMEYLENWEKAKEEKKRRNQRKRVHWCAVKMHIRCAVNELKLFFKE